MKLGLQFMLYSIWSDGKGTFQNLMSQYLFFFYYLVPKKKYIEKYILSKYIE